MPSASACATASVRLQAAELADLVAGWSGAPAADALGDAARKAVHDELILQLPTAGGGPLASPELGPAARDEPAAAARTGQARARLAGQLAGAGARLRTRGRAHRAGHARRSGQPDDPATAGGSLAYLAAVASFASGLAERGRVLPVLAAEDGTLAARWRPVLGGADVQRARDLAAAMPPACRALGVEAPGPLLGDALDALADAAARSRLPSSLLPARRGRVPARLPVAERYVLALTAPDARVEVLTPGMRTRPPRWRPSWTRGWTARGSRRARCGPASGSPSRRAAEGDPWRVEFALQSADDPSLMVSAADVWAGLGAGMAPGGDPVEELLAGLGAAARLFAEMEDALREAAPALVELDTPGAFRFLKETGPLLAGAGFGVLLPDWVRKARLGLKLTTRSRSASGASAAGPGAARFGLGDIVDFKYDVAVGDEALDPDELAELARLKVPLVRLRGQWVELDDAHLKAALKFLERNQAGTMTTAGALAAGLGGWPGPGGGPGRGGPPGRGGRRRLAGRPDLRPGRPAARADDHAGRLPRRAAALPGARAVLAVLPRRARPRRRPGRRHGPGQDDPAAVAHRGAASLVPVPRCWSARCRWSATGSGRRPGSPQTSGCTCTTVRTGWRASRSPRR